MVLNLNGILTPVCPYMQVYDDLGMNELRYKLDIYTPYPELILLLDRNNYHNNYYYFKEVMR